MGIHAPPTPIATSPSGRRQQDEAARAPKNPRPERVLAVLGTLRMDVFMSKYPNLNNRFLIGRDVGGSLQSVVTTDARMNREHGDHKSATAAGYDWVAVPANGMPNRNNSLL